MTNHDTPTLFTLANQVRDKALRNLDRTPSDTLTPEQYLALMDLRVEFTVAYDAEVSALGTPHRATVGTTFRDYETAARAVETVRRDPNKKNARVERRIVSEWKVCEL